METKLLFFNKSVMKEKLTGSQACPWHGMRLRDMPTTTHMRGAKWLNWLPNRHSTWYARIRQHPTHNDRRTLGGRAEIKAFANFFFFMYSDYTWFLVTLNWSHPIYLQKATSSHPSDKTS